MSPVDPRSVLGVEIECQFSALGTPCVLREGEGNCCPEEGDGIWEIAPESTHVK